MSRTSCVSPGGECNTSGSVVGNCDFNVRSVTAAAASTRKGIVPHPYKQAIGSSVATQY